MGGRNIFYLGRDQDQIRTGSYQFFLSQLADHLRKEDLYYLILDSRKKRNLASEK